MIIGGFAAGVRILLEKGLSRHHISEDREILEKYQKKIFYQKMKEARGRSREEPQGRLTRRGRNPWLRRPVVWPPWPTSAIALSHISSSPKT
jgi:hypothetical protein